MPVPCLFFPNGLNQIASRVNYKALLIGAKGGSDLEINRSGASSTNPGGGGYHYEEVWLQNSTAPDWGLN